MQGPGGRNGTAVPPRWCHFTGFLSAPIVRRCALPSSCVPASIRAVSTVTVGGRECTQRCRSDGHQSGGPPDAAGGVLHRRIAATAGARAGDLTEGPCGRSPPLGRVQARHGGPEPAPVRLRTAGPNYGRRGDAWTAQAVPRQQPTAAARQLRGRYRGWPVSSVGPVAILPRDQGRPLSSVHRRRPRLCAASKRACERLPRQHETAAACSVSATNRQGGRVGLVYMDHAPPVWGCPGPAARPTSACSAEQRARPATAAAAATVFSRNGGHQRRHVGYWTRPAD